MLILYHIFVLSNKSNEITFEKEKIVIASKRGGTSGIGINTYFNGGFVFDIGIKNEKDLLVPSSIANRRNKKPLVIYNGKTPDWEIGICIPKRIKNKSEQEEVEFFNENCPIDKSYVNETLYEALYGTTSAIIENDLKTFCKSVNRIQRTRWKILERSQYGQSLIELENRIRNLGADCVGMSSFGPTLFFLGENIKKIIIELNLESTDIICYSSKMNNSGRVLTYA